MKLLFAMLGLMLMQPKAEWRLLPSPPVDTLARDPVLALTSHAGSLFASTRFGLFRSTDGGLAWNAVKAPSVHRAVTYLGSAGGNLYAAEDFLLYRSPDQGRTWDRVADSSYRSRFRIQGDSALLVSGIFESDLAYSTDNGINWRTYELTPENQQVTALLDLDSLLLLGTPSGVFASSDLGLTWKPVAGDWLNSGLSEGASLLLRKGDDLYLAPSRLGLFASGDMGRTWSDISPKPAGSDSNLFFRGFTVTSLEIVDGRMFAAVASLSDNYDYPNGIYMSEDAGKTWTPRNTGLPTVPNHFSRNTVIASDRIHSLGKVLFATSPEGVYRSTDYGRKWVSANAGIDPSVRRNHALESFRIVGGEPNLTAMVEGKRAHYRSTDEGLTWIPAARDKEGILAQASGAGKTYALFRDRLLVSGNAGAAWSPVHGPWEEAGDDLDLMSVSGSRLCVATSSLISSPKFYRSRDGGATWLNDESVLETWRCQARIGEVRFKGIGPQLARSRDSGRTWTPAPPTGFSGNITALEAAGNLLIALAGDSLRLSSDQGATWRLPDGGIAGLRVHALIRNREGFLAATGRGLFLSPDGSEWKPNGEKGLTATGITALAASGENLVALNGSGLFHSRDHGGHWTPCDSAPPGTRLLAAQNGFFYAGTEARGVWISADTGKTWTATRFLDPRYSSIAPIMAMAASPLALFVGTRFDLFRTGDKGATWTRQKTMLARLEALAYAEDTLWAVASDGSLRVSEDQGMLWEGRLAPGAGDIGLLSGQGPFLAAGSLDGIFFPAAAKNTEWLPQGNGLPGKKLTSLLVSEGRLFAGLFDQGLWEMTLPANPVRIDAPDQSAPVNAMNLTRSHGARIFQFRLSEPATIRVSIYSVGGKRLAGLASRTSRAGMEQVEWNGGAGEGGPYLYRAEAYSLLHPGKRLHVQRGLLPP